MKTRSNKHLFLAIIGPVCLASVLACGLLLVLVPSVLAASGKGHIYGRLLDGTKKNAPLSGQAVTLQMAQGSSGKDLESVKTDSQGKFDFANLATDKGVIYAVFAKYQGAQYVTTPVHLDTQSSQKLDLTVYDATNSIANFAIVEATVLIHQPDTAHGTIPISEIVTFNNVDNHTYVGSLDASKGKPNALRFALPAGARNLSLNSGFDGYQAISVDKGFATTAVLPPGSTQFAFSYSVPYSGTSYNFSYKAVYPTLDFSLLAPPSLHANSKIMQTGGIITASDQNSYRVMHATKLVADTTVQAILEGLTPPTITVSSSAVDLRWFWVLVGILILMAILVVSTFLYRITHKSEFAYQNRSKGKGRYTPASKRAPRTGERDYADDNRRSGGRRAPAPNSRGAARIERKNDLMQQLLVLDRHYEAGKMPRDRYLKRREEIKTQLRLVMDSSDVIPRAASQHGSSGRSRW
jgi:hypothetical protein